MTFWRLRGGRDQRGSVMEGVVMVVCPASQCIRRTACVGRLVLSRTLVIPPLCIP